MPSAFPLVTTLRVSLSHFQTFVWLRWRIRINQLRHSSTLGKALAAILLASFAMVCVGLLLAGGLLGAIVPRLAPRENYFLLWDALMGLFCFIWVIHVSTDLQRSDAVTFDRILHLPVAFSQAFAINYLSSLMSMTFVSMTVFCIGFIFGSCFSIGPIALFFPIPFFFFLLAITALTYQLQGWLAAMMSNPRRRQTIMILIPLCIIAISQIPALVATRFAKNEAERNRPQVSIAPPTEVSLELLPDVELDSLRSMTIDTNTQPDINATVASDQAALDQAATIASEARTNSERQQSARAESKARWIGRISVLNLVAPPLWMAGCIESIMSGTPHAIWLTCAMAFGGFVSLRSNYRQTVRFYKGETDSRAMAKSLPKPVRVRKETPRENISDIGVPKKLLLVERAIPFVSEETAAVVTMTLQSMKRAPEVKFYLLLPLIAPFILFGVMQTWRLPNIDELKSSIIVGFTACSLFITSGMLGNYFAFDRAGFRSFVLSPIRRERILLGRNLATVPFLLLQTVLLALAIGIFFGMAIDKVLCAILLSACMLPPYCLLMNVMSILAPFPLAAGSIQPKQINLIPVLFSLALSMLMPLIALLALLPLGLEWILDLYFPATASIPFAFLLSIPWMVASLFLYRWLLPWEGMLLANREKELLRIVTSKIE